MFKHKKHKNSLTSWLNFVVREQKWYISVCGLVLGFAEKSFSLISQNVMEHFNPGLRNLVNLGKNYEKSVSGEFLNHTDPQLFRERGFELRIG